MCLNVLFLKAKKGTEAAGFEPAVRVNAHLISNQAP
jgi:hypothetical protein